MSAFFFDLKRYKHDTVLVLMINQRPLELDFNVFFAIEKPNG